MKKKLTVAVGMSGGVDSSVAAYLLKKQGYNVIGLFMKNWEDEKSNCSAKEDFSDVSKICNQLSIDYYTINFTKEYFDRVFSKCLKDFKKGITPNPDILCNKEIKFDLFLKKALEIGADYLATGHYAQIEKTDGQNHLIKASDLKKDQSYFLYTIKSKILEKVLFPIGHLEKTEVRKIAKENNFINHDKKDSTGICFIGKRKFSDFLSTFIPFTKGRIRSMTEKDLGEHLGISFYTIGQRKGLDIGGEGEAWFVSKKDVKNNILYVSQGSESEHLFSRGLIAENISWVTDEDKIKLPFNCKAKIRYRQEDQKCTIEKIENGKIFVSFKIKQRAATEGQSIVFYKDNICLGGAVITKILK